MVSVELELTNVNDVNTSIIDSITDQVYNQIDDVESHQKIDFKQFPHPYSPSSCIYGDGDGLGNANITDISISGIDCDMRSYGYDSDNLLNSGYAASVSEATRSIGSVGGFEESEKSGASTCYMSSVEQLSITPANWQTKSVSPPESSQDEEDIHVGASNVLDFSIRECREKRRKNRAHSRRNARKVTISSEFRNFLGWDSTGDEKNDETQFQSSDVETPTMKKMGKFSSRKLDSTHMQHNVLKEIQPVCKEPVKGVLTRWSKYSVPCIVVHNVHSQDSEEDVSTINDSRFDTENFPIVDDKIRDDVDKQTDRPTYKERSGRKLGWLYMSIIFISILTLLALIVVVLTQRI